MNCSGFPSVITHCSDILSVQIISIGTYAASMLENQSSYFLLTFKILKACNKLRTETWSCRSSLMRLVSQDEVFYVRALAIESWLVRGLSKNASTNLLMSIFKLDIDTICVTQKDHNNEKRAQIKSNLILKEKFQPLHVSG